MFCSLNNLSQKHCNIILKYLQIPEDTWLVLGYWRLWVCTVTRVHNWSWSLLLNHWTENMKDYEQFLRDINKNLNIKVVVFEKRLQLSDGEYMWRHLRRMCWCTQGLFEWNWTVGYMGWDLQIWMQMKCNVVLNELNRLPNYCNITSVFISKFSNYRHISNNFWKKNS